MPPFILRILYRALPCTLLLLAGGCAARRIIVGDGKPPELYDSKPERVLTGRASFYAGRWIGRKTANGETYHADDVTAAHRSLAFGTVLRVTNLRNGKSVILRVNNRGPYARGRILDLSLVAARKIEMIEAGVVPVRAEVLRPIPVLSRSNLKVTAIARKRAQARAAAETERNKPKRKPAPEAAPADSSSSRRRR